MEQAITYTPRILAPLPRILPEQAGVRSADVLALVDGLQQAGICLHSLLLVRGGKLYAEGYYEPYAADQFQTVFSVSKTLTSLAVGIAVGEGVLSLQDRVVDLFADEVRKARIAPGKELAALTLRDLLRMATGQPEESMGEDLLVAFLRQPFCEMPGQTFRYNSMATYMCSAALHKKGIDLEAFLQERIFTPMGVHGVHWIRCARGICLGGAGCSLTPEILAMVGILLAQKGKWNGKQLVPQAYIEEATAKQIESDPPWNDPESRHGYGYQIWRERHNGFAATGAQGQYCLVHPEKDAVLVCTAMTNFGSEILLQYMNRILLKMRDEPLEPDPENVAKLVERLSSLRVERLPCVDDGSAVPQALRDITLPLPEGGETARLRLLADGRTIRAEIPFGIFDVPRGDRNVIRTPYSAIQWSPPQKPGNDRQLCGWGMHEGTLEFRMQSLEYVQEFYILLTEKAGRVEFVLGTITYPEGRQEICRYMVG